jgi:hypothetical protein
LKEQAGKTDVSIIPRLFQQQPELLLVFIIVYPHRLIKDVAKFLDGCLQNLPPAALEE